MRAFRGKISTFPPKNGVRAIKDGPNPHATDLIKARGHRRDDDADDDNDGDGVGE